MASIEIKQHFDLDNKKNNNKRTKLSKSDDDIVWKKNWFDATKETENTSSAQRNYIVNALIKRFDSYEHEDAISLIFALRIRTLLVMFFENNYSERHFAFLSRDFANHGGWFTTRTKQEDDIIQAFQYAYALCDEGHVDKGKDVFTTADKELGLLRHNKYVETLKKI